MLKENVRIGVVGLGFVGKAVRDGYGKLGARKILTYDINGSGNCPDLVRLLEGSEYVFVCVPTPQKSRKPDFSIVHEVCSEMDKLCSKKKFVIKSTVLPSEMRLLADETVKNNHIIANPEFLTQRTALRDFLKPSRIIFGCDNRDVLRDVSRALGSLFYGKGVKIYRTGLETAMKCKYAANCFGFVKVLYFNAMHSWCGSQEEYKTLLKTVLDSGWVAPMHTMVPGPDGGFGVGGACLPKDTNALAHELSKLGDFERFNFVRSALMYNDEIREE